MTIPTTVCDALASVPRQIESHGVLFQPHIFYNRAHHDGGHDVRFAYELVDRGRLVEPIQSETSSWFNPYAGGAQQGFLYLVEHIENDAELVKAILETRAWLVRNELVAASDYPAFAPESDCIA